MTAGKMGAAARVVAAPRVVASCEGGPYEGLVLRTLAVRLRRMLVWLGLDGAEVGLALVTDEHIAELNQRHRDEPGATDVLSFPLLSDEAAAQLGFGLDAERRGSPFPPSPGAWRKAVRRAPAGCVLLGDLVLSGPTTQRQARAAGRLPLDEATMLLAHGLLHLLGYDHRDSWEEQVMVARTAVLEQVAGRVHRPAVKHSASTGRHARKGAKVR
jgi:probable rRNA maturation factor